jgi:hypothetical protein
VVTRGLRSFAGPLAFVLALAGGAVAAPPDDRILPPEQHTSDKARALARTYVGDLQQFNAEIYNCLPWLDVRKEGIGFYKPKHLTGDQRYLSLNIDVEQQPSAEFGRYSRDERASRMFSRYVPALLRRMTQHGDLLRDSRLDGFTIILNWLKSFPQKSDERAVNETIAVFVAKPVAGDFLAGRLPVSQLASQAYVLGWDGATPVGRLEVAGWNDSFLSTYQIANYQPEPGVTCSR